MCFQLRKTSKAGAFSEKFFEKLYLVEKKAFLKHSKRAAKFEHRAFDANAVAEQFDANYLENLEFVKANLPEELLDKVADVRVLALGSAEYDVAYAITRYCGQINRKCESVEAKYGEELEKMGERLGWVTVNSLEYLISAPIESVTELDGSVIIKTSPEYSGNAYKVKLTGVTSGAEDLTKLLGTTVIKHELLPYENSAERISFGLLCMAENSELVAVSLAADSVEISD